MAYWVNHLLHKCEDLSLDPQHQHAQQVWQPAYDPSAQEAVTGSLEQAD